MSNLEKRKVPKRRFKEFENAPAWEQHKLGEIAEVIAGGDINKSKIRVTGKFPVIANALTDDGIVGYYDDDFRVEVPAVTVTGRGEIGHAKARTTNFTPVVRLLSIKSQHNIYFLENSINQKRVIVESTGIPQLTVPQLKNYKILVTSIEEEKQIGSFFNQLDTLITLQQRKLNKLNNLKKSYLAEMFPAEGERKPKRRFAGFTDAWEQHNFMELIDNIIDFRGKTPKKLGMTWSNEGILALSAQNVKEGYIDKTIDAHYGGQALYSKWMSGRELHKGQVIFTTEAPMGNVARIPDKNKYILSQRAIAFNVNNAMVTEDFLMYLLESPSVKNNLLRISSGGTAKGISQKTLSSLMVKVPISLKEQERISFEFYNIDTLITLQQRKINKLKKLKDAYLNEMFV
ncbi:restriction endonuclease subunit S [Lactobacillus bombicola]|uniref:restriction endonuclease subunit S n=1 Tax=Lactobacillus bombicola TaxID=1505723 RepID=UPI000E59756F|nr:restriction endonuclease subunit S [Lactobacillus bombicola]RHW48891.1 restriction endonuclease subunit S [Lactobacillus bombicola]